MWKLWLAHCIAGPQMNYIFQVSAYQGHQVILLLNECEWTRGMFHRVAAVLNRVCTTTNRAAVGVLWIWLGIGRIHLVTLNLYAEFWLNA